MDKTKQKLHLRCPGCQAELVVDARTGHILHHRQAKRPAAGGKDFDALMKDLDRDKSHAEELFERERAALKDRDRLLEEKFKEAMERAREEDDETPPPRPFDFD